MDEIQKLIGKLPKGIGYESTEPIRRSRRAATDSHGGSRTDEWGYAR
jgi:hypothetical protein